MSIWRVSGRLVRSVAVVGYVCYVAGSTLYKVLDARSSGYAEAWSILGPWCQLDTNADLAPSKAVTTVPDQRAADTSQPDQHPGVNPQPILGAYKDSTLTPYPTPIVTALEGAKSAFVRGIPFNPNRAASACVTARRSDSLDSIKRSPWARRRSETRP